MVEEVWNESYVPIFLERFVLPVLAATVIAVIVLNPFKLDWQQRISLLAGVLALAYFAGYTLHKGKSEPTPATHASVPAATAPAEASKASGDAKTSGSQSPAVTGDGNNIKYDDSSHPEKTTEPPKKE